VKARPSRNLTKSQSSWLAMLRAIPVQNTAAHVSESEQDEVCIIVKIKPIPFLFAPFSWLIRPRRERRFRLEALGSRVWHLCDGERTVEEIVDIFAIQFGLTFHEARVAVTRYMKTLVQHGALAVAVDNAQEVGA